MFAATPSFSAAAAAAAFLRFSRQGFCATGATGRLRVDLETSMDGAAWSPVEYPFWATRSGVLSSGPGRTEVDMRAPWQWVLRYTAVVVQGLLQEVAYALGVVGVRGRWTPRAAMMSFVVMASASAAAGVGAAVGGWSGRGWRSGGTGMAVWFSQAAFQAVCAAAFAYEKW